MGSWKDRLAGIFKPGGKELNVTEDMVFEPFPEDADLQIYFGKKRSADVPPGYQQYEISEMLLNSGTPKTQKLEILGKYFYQLCANRVVLTVFPTGGPCDYKSNR